MALRKFYSCHPFLFPHIAKSLQLCLTLCDPIDGSPLGSAVPGTLQARTLEWVAISFSSAWKWNVKGKSLSHVRLLVTPWTVAHQAPPSMEVSRQEYWSGVPGPSPIPTYSRWQKIMGTRKGIYRVYQKWAFPLSPRVFMWRCGRRKEPCHAVGPVQCVPVRGALS